MSGHYIFGPPPPAPTAAPAPAPYAHGGQPAYGQHGGYSQPSHPAHQQQHQRGPPHRGGHQFSGGREYPPSGAPAEYYQVQYTSQQSHAPPHAPGAAGYGQWTQGQYHQASPSSHGSHPAGHAAAATHATYPLSAYGLSQSPSPYGASQQGYGHPHTQYAVHYTSAAPPYAPQPTPHDQGPPSGFPGDRGSRAPAAPSARPGYDGNMQHAAIAGAVAGAGPYAQAYAPDHHVPQYGSPAQYPPAYATPTPPFGPVTQSFPSRHEPSMGSNMRRGRGGGHYNTGRGGKFHQNQHNQDRQKQQHPKIKNESAAAESGANSGAPNADTPAANKNKKRKTDPLGLKGTGGASSEDDEDDEARLPKVLGLDGIALPEDTAAWIANRKRNFPTKARIAQKAAEEAERKAAEEAEEAKQREKEAEAKELEKQANQLRKQLKKVESSLKRKREQHDDGEELRESASDESESDDEQPEAMSSRAPETTAVSKADVNQPCKYFSTAATCGKGSKCRFVHDQATREEALREKAANGDRHTIRQRLVLNDKNIEDLDILESIVFLRDRGVEGSESRVKALARQQEQSLSKPKPTSTLPAKPPTLPEKPVVKKEGFHPKHHHHHHHNNHTKEPGIKREPGLPLHQPSSKLAPNPASGVLYQNWNPTPYGDAANTGPRSDDLP